jgi:hypothetical protein
MLGYYFKYGHDDLRWVLWWFFALSTGNAGEVPQIVPRFFQFMRSFGNTQSELM